MKTEVKYFIDWRDEPEKDGPWTRSFASFSSLKKAKAFLRAERQKWPMMEQVLVKVTTERYSLDDEPEGGETVKSCVNCKWLDEAETLHKWHVCNCPIVIPECVVRVVRASVNIKHPFTNCPKWAAKKVKP